MTTDENKFAPGDVVMLKSHVGSEMVVMDVVLGSSGSPGDRVLMPMYLCAWHGRDGQPYAERYPGYCLQRAP